MTFQHVLLISSHDRQLTKNLEIARPLCESVDDYSLKATYIDAYELKEGCMYSDHPYPQRKTMLDGVFSKTPMSKAAGNIAINRAYCPFNTDTDQLFRTFFQSFGYNPNQKSPYMYPSVLLNWAAVVEYETSKMDTEIMSIAEAIHLSNVDTQVWHFYTSPYPQGFGLYNTFDKQMHIIDGTKLLQQIWHSHDTTRPELKVYNPILAEVFDRLFNLSFEMWQNEIQKDRVATHKPGASQFSIYNNQNPSNKDSK